MARTRGEVDKPFRDDPQLKLLQERGYAHERLYIAQLEAAGRTVVEMTRGVAATPAELRAAHDETVEAMRAGTDVIFQAHVLRRPLARPPGLPAPARRSAVGPRRVQLRHRRHEARQAGQGRGDRPDVRLRGPARAGPGHPTRDDRGGDRRPRRARPPARRLRRLLPGRRRRRFEARIDPAAGDAVDTYPEPVDHCRVCSWWTMCVDRRRADDHLSLVANITRSNRRRLVAAGVDDARGARRARRRGRRSRSSRPRILERLRHQAGAPARLPPRPRPPLRADPAQRRRSGPGPRRAAGARRRSTSSSTSRPTRGPSTTASSTSSAGPRSLGRRAGLPRDLGARPGRREGRLRGVRRPRPRALRPRPRDARLPLRRLRDGRAQAADAAPRDPRGRGRPPAPRPDVLVNLYDHVVRSGIRASVECYSIKKIEKFYLPEREGGITDAGFSVVEYERWMETGDPAILDAIAAYNRDDCVSTWGLRDWLEARRVEAAPLYPDGVVPRPETVDPRARRRSSRPPRPRPGPARTRSASASRRTAPSETTSSRAAGCSRPSSTGIAARRSPSGGTTTGCSTPRSTTSSRTAPRSAGWSSSRTSGRSRSRASIATGSTRRRRRSSMPATAPLDPTTGQGAGEIVGARSAPRAARAEAQPGQAASDRAHPRGAVPDRTSCATRSAGSATT